MAVAASILAAGCTPDPWPSGTRTTHSAIELSGSVIGEELARRAPPGPEGTRISRERTYRVRLRGDVLEWSVGETGTIDGDGRLRQLVVARDREEQTWTPEPDVYWLAEAAPVLARVAAGEPMEVRAWWSAAGQPLPTRLEPRDGGVEVQTELARAFLEVDPDGRVIGSRAGGIAVRPVSGPALPDDPPDLLALLRLPTARWDGAREAVRATWRLEGIAPEAVHHPPWQVAEGDRVVVERPLHAEIPRRTRERIGALVAEVDARLALGPRPGAPDPDAALRAGRGDCNEHAAVLVALAREAGLAARPVTGWVYLDEGVPPGLYPHAWVELDVGAPSGWIPVDPVLGQIVADAAHVWTSQGIAGILRPTVTREDPR